MDKCESSRSSVTGNEEGVRRGEGGGGGGRDVYRDKHDGYYKEPSLNLKVMLQSIKSSHFCFGVLGMEHNSRFFFAQIKCKYDTDFLSDTISRYTGEGGRRESTRGGGGGGEGNCPGFPIFY